MKLEALRKSLKALFDESEVIATVAAPTPEQIARIKAIPAEMIEIRSQIEAVEAIASVRGWAEQAGNALPLLAATNATPATEDPADATRRAPAGGEPPKAFKSFGDMLAAVRVAGMPGGSIDPRLSTRAASGASEMVGSDGGFLVSQETSSELLRRTYETGQLTSRVRRLPVGPNSNGIKINGIDETSRVNGSRWGGIRSYWIGESDAITASRPKFRQIELNLHKLTGLVYATDELLEDQSAFETVAMEGFAEEFGFKLDEALLRGTGSGQPMGVLNSSALIPVAKESGQAAGTIVFENLVKMWSRMWGRSRANAVWFINQDIEPQLFSMGLIVGTGGTPVYLPPGGLSQSPYGTLFGRPVVPIEQCSTLGTVGDILLADYSQYVMIEKGGLQTASSIHVRFLNDEQVFRFTLRTDGQPIWGSPLTPNQGTNTLSPFVALATR